MFSLAKFARRSVQPQRQGLSARASVRQFSASPAALPDLPYSYSALEPAISGQIMEIHHSKHHQTYVNNYNAAMEQLQQAESKGDTAGIINLQGAINFNGGGHINHSIFWQNLAPPSEGGGAPPTGPLAQAIDQAFGSLDAFQTKFSAKTAAVQGSGWGWLVYNKPAGRIEITTRANQDPVTGDFVPLLGVDVWEHAYYLQYKNVRPDYLKQIWTIVNWQDVARRYEAARK